MITIVQPLLTEKTLLLASKGWYTFAVDIKSNKRQIAKNVSTQYKVSVIDVRTSIRPGKEHRVGKKQITVRNADKKKAIVRLKKGQSIPAFEMTTESEKK